MLSAISAQCSVSEGTFTRTAFTYRRNPFHRLFFFNSETAKSQARAVSAMYVSEGLTQEADVMHAPSGRKRFFASCAWLCSFKTDVLASRPMRAVPISGIPRPVVELS